MSSTLHFIAVAVFLSLVFFGGSNAQLSTTFYGSSCPNVSSVVRGVIEQAQGRDARAGAKLLRLHFHDCFVNGCDASILLESADGISSEQDARANAAVEGYSIVDDIKTAVESVCPGIVSCADILAIAAQISVDLAGGPTWEVKLGRRDGRTANPDGANNNLPAPFHSPTEVESRFTDQGLDSTDLVALSGAHTFGRARCVAFQSRLYNFQNTNSSDPSLDATYRDTLRQNCRESGTDNVLFNLDPSTPNDFDNNYFTNLQNNRGLLQTDQQLSSGDTAGIVDRFAGSQAEFFTSFAQSMVKMGDIRPLTGNNGDIRTDCKRVN